MDRQKTFPFEFYKEQKYYPGKQVFYFITVNVGRCFIQTQVTQKSLWLSVLEFSIEF